MSSSNSSSEVDESSRSRSRSPRRESKKSSKVSRSKKSKKSEEATVKKKKKKKKEKKKKKKKKEPQSNEDQEPESGEVEELDSEDEPPPLLDLDSEDEVDEAGVGKTPKSKEPSNPFKSFVRMSAKDAVEFKQRMHEEGIRVQKKQKEEELLAQSFAAEEERSRATLLASASSGSSSLPAVEVSSAIDILNDEKCVSWNLSKLSANNKDATSWVTRLGNGYGCSICQNSPYRSSSRQGKWISVPCLNSKMNDAITKHKKTEIHKDTINTTKTVKSMPRHIEQLNDLELMAVMKRFRDIYYIVNHDRPLSDLSWIVELETDNGAYEKCSDALEGNKYQHADFGKEVLHALACTVRELYVKPVLDASWFLGFTTDEGSNNGKSQLVSFYRANPVGMCTSYSIQLICVVIIAFFVLKLVFLISH